MGNYSKIHISTEQFISNIEIISFKTVSRIKQPTKEIQISKQNIGENNAINNKLDISKKEISSEKKPGPDSAEEP